jgi:copper resistance protein B
MIASALLLALQAMPGMAMPETAMPTSHPAQSDDPQGTDQPPGSADAPPPAQGLAAAPLYGAPAMAQAHHTMMEEYNLTWAAARLDLGEAQIQPGKAAGYRWEGEAFVGDIDRFILRGRGQQDPGGGPDETELQALYSHALGPWWNLQAGIRQDLTPAPRTHAALGVEGTLPYRIALTATAFLSDRGTFSARIEAWLDQRLTRHWVLQPRVEVNLASGDDPARQQRAGLSEAEGGLRLRYELTRNVAPYIGGAWSQTKGQGSTPALVLGLRALL